MSLACFTALWLIFAKKNLNLVSFSRSLLLLSRSKIIEPQVSISLVACFAATLDSGLV